MLYYVILYYVMLYYVLLCYVVLCFVIYIYTPTILSFPNKSVFPSRTSKLRSTPGADANVRRMPA